MSEVKNGIGGTYRFEYSNSTTFDNTGGDGIPDLPMNYKVCNKLTIEDGVGNRVITRYAYSGGYAFSAFINGKKETDYFGFSRFETIDAYNSKSMSNYYTTPFDDFRKNRALAGAIKESYFYGSDNIEYAKTYYNYKIHDIQTSEKILKSREQKMSNKQIGSMNKVLKQMLHSDPYLFGLQGNNQSKLRFGTQWARQMADKATNSADA